MFLILSKISTLTSAFKLIGLLLVFFALLYGAHLFTKWYARSKYVNSRASNISIVESQQIAPGKNIVIAKVGEKYVSFILFKDNAVFLTEIKEDELILHSSETMQGAAFRDVFKKIKGAAGNDNEEKE